jgi:hypothetical protein
MSTAEWIGSIGVGLLLIAFFANLAGWVDRKSRIYTGTNAVGGGLACYSSWLIGFMPFVVLEGTWCLFAAFCFAKPGLGR